MEKEDESSSQPPDERSCENNDEDEDKDSGFVEVDPTGRYGRYDEILGKGAFKTVYRAFDEFDGMEVAWNQVRVQDLLQSPNDIDRLYDEVNLLKTLKHKNIIKFYNSWVDPKTQNVNFITEIFTSGTLRQYRKKHKHCDLKAVKNWSRQILRGLLYLHSHDPPIIHRDLKCDNIFVNGNQGEVKIGDLGLAAILKQAQIAHSVIGTPEFMAPELYEENYNELVDIYSFGMCVLEMVTFEYPYSECTNAAQIYKKVTSGKKPAALDKVKDPDVRSFVEKCLTSASRRLPARELLMDPFLNDGEPIDSINAIPRTESKPEEIVGLATIAEEPTANRGDSVSESMTDHDKDDHLSLFYREVSEGSLLVNSKKYPSLTDSESEVESAMAEIEREGENEGVELRRSGRDFNVKGKMDEENDTIYLRLRIADSSGHVRNIHFPFDIRGDTAFSVASEMVTELDLSDTDVTNIAEMIDREVLQLYPDWSVGVSIEENIMTDTDYEPTQTSAIGSGLVSETDTEAASPSLAIAITATATAFAEESFTAGENEENDTAAGDNQDSLLTVQSTGSVRSPHHQREGSFSSQDDFFPSSFSRAQNAVLSPNTKMLLGATSLPNMSLDRATFHGRFWENLDDAHELNSASSDDNGGGNLSSIEEGERDEKDEHFPFVFSDTDSKNEESESGSVQKKSYAMVVKANSAGLKDRTKAGLKKNMGRVFIKTESEGANSSEIRNSIINYSSNLTALDIQKTFQNILHPIAPRKENHGKVNGTYQHHVNVQLSFNQESRDREVADDDIEDSDLSAMVEKLKLEKEKELKELEDRYKKKLMELQNRPGKQRKINLPQTKTIGFDVESVTNQETLA